MNLWSLFRELYCRAWHQSSPVLCHYIDWEFRPDLVVVAIVALIAYAIVHFWRLRRVSLRTHVIVLAGLWLTSLLVLVLARLLPGKWEAWY